MSPRCPSASIVLLANRAPGCVAGVRSLGRRGIHTTVASEDLADPARASRYIDETVVVADPFVDVEEYKSDLLSLANRPGVRAIVPFREVDVYALSRYRAEFDDHVATLWPAFDTLRRVHDRMRLVEAGAEAGVPVPRTKLLGEVDDWDRELIVKARYALLAGEYADELPSDTIREVGRTRYLEPGREPDRAAIREAMGHTPIVQEYVPGPEYSFRALYDHGDPVVTSQIRQLRAFKYAGGASVCRSSVHVPELEEAGTALLDRLDWHGLAEVEFIEDARTGEFTLMEVNPRIWASISCDVAAGVDFPYYYWLLAAGESVSGDTDYDVGVVTHLLRGELVYLASVLLADNPLVERPALHEAVIEVVNSLRVHPRFDYLDLDDPRPFIRDVANAVAPSKA